MKITAKMVIRALYIAFAIFITWGILSIWNVNVNNDVLNPTPEKIWSFNMIKLIFGW